MDCFVCLRITPTTVLQMAHRVWHEDPQVARNMGIRASGILREGYSQNPMFFSGRSAKTILGSLFYLLGRQNGQYKTQREISLALEVTDYAVRKNLRHWEQSNLMPLLKEESTVNYWGF